MDLLRQSQTIEAAAGALARWRERLAAGDSVARDEAPLADRRDASGKRLRDALTALAPSRSEVELRDALVLWVEALTAARVSHEAEVEAVRAEQEPRIELHLDLVRKVSLRDAVRGLVAARSPEGARRHLDAIAAGAPIAVAARRRQRELEREVLARFDVAAPDAHGLAGGPAILAALAPAARAFLRLSGDLARDELKRRPRDESRMPLALDLVLARGATEGWPTRLGPRFVLEAFPSWREGVRLPAFGVPEAHGGASFALAFARFGAALRVAYAPRALPFVLRVPVAFVDRERFSLLFASLLASRPFSLRRLGLAQRVAAAQTRAFASAFLLHARRLAARIARRDGMPADELAHEVWDETHPAAAYFLEPSPGDVQRALALFTVLPLEEELRQRHDEDWFDNPRAVTLLRSRSSAPLIETPPADGAANDLAKAFEVALR